MPHHHRLDLAAQREYRSKKNPNRVNRITFSLYDAYNRANPVDIRLIPTRNPTVVQQPTTGQYVVVNPYQTELLNLLPIVPGISYTVKW